jgi:hypothetical protein
VGLFDLTERRLLAAMKLSLNAVKWCAWRSSRCRARSARLVRLTDVASIRGAPVTCAGAAWIIEPSKLRLTVSEIKKPTINKTSVVAIEIFRAVRAA